MSNIRKYFSGLSCNMLFLLLPAILPILLYDDKDTSFWDRVEISR